MVDDRPRVGALISAIGAVLLGVSVFMPWYGVSLTANGAAAAQQELNSVAQQFGNATFQVQAKTVGAGFSAVAGHQVATLSAHDVLKDLDVVLLLLAALALGAALWRLAAAAEPIGAGGVQIALVGLVASLCVLFRMVDRPSSGQGVLALSLSWGVWLALVSSAAIIVGGLWPTRAGPGTDSAERAFDKLSGWTPEA